ncbi:hypothetical protein KJ605_00745 [Patescibacteria group bacterium]|nr:hypothetical protein [Patescibacteria group bacterium]MBU1970294.1 hypothetical protein [Patescibacteria group bacterium]
MTKGFAHPYLLLAGLVVVGAGLIVYTSSKNLAGLVLGTTKRNENIYQRKTDGVKVTVISPNSSWDLVQYLCENRDECQTSPTSGKWWAAVSGAPTPQEGHEVFIQKSDGWQDYSYLKIYAKSAKGAVYQTLETGQSYHLVETSLLTPLEITFVSTGK